MIYKSLKNLTEIKPLALFATTLVSATGTLTGLIPAAYAETAKSADAFVDSIGVNVHLPYTNTAYGDYDGIIKPRLQEVGIRHIRDSASEGDEPLLNKFRDLSNSGIRLTLIANNPPQEVVAITKSLQGTIVTVEGPNESDLSQYEFSYNGQGFPEGTRAYQRDLYAAMNEDEATASIPLLLPSVGWGENAQRLEYIPDGDFGTLHPYPYQGGMLTEILDSYFLPNVRIIAGDKPLQTTETGYFTLPGAENAGMQGVSEQAAGKYLPRLLLESFNRDIRRTFLYELINLSDGSLNPDENFGLLRADGTPKPAYTAIRNLITLLREPGANFSPGDLNYTLSGDTTDVHHTLLQKSNGVFYLVLWQEVRSWDNQNKNDIAVGNREVTLNLNTAISSATVYEPLTSTDPISESTNPSSLTISVPDHPLVVELRI